MNIHDFKRKKDKGEKISVITCYDYPSARTIADTAIDCVLVGDSVAMVVHGHKSTIMATMDMMALHTASVARGLTQQFLVTDLPFLCHRASQSETIAHAKTLLQSGAQAIKIEGADPTTCETIAHLVQSGVPVMGHIGLTPQSIHQLGGFIVQGKGDAQITTLIEQAQALEASGCFAVVVECVPGPVAARITQAIQIPTIGIGAGICTDGQVLVFHDLLGLQTELRPKFVKPYLAGKRLISEAISQYAAEVQQAHFPTLDHTF